MGIIGYGYYTGDRLSRVYAPMVNATMEIKLSATTAHLWFEEIISGDRHEEIDVVWEQQERAEWYAKAMLEGGSSPEGTFLPLADAGMRGKISEVHEKLAEFRRIAETRFREQETSGVGTGIDQRYDAVFRDFLHTADEVEILLQRTMVDDLNRFRRTQILLIVICLFLFIFSGVIFLHFNGRMGKYILSLKQANAALNREIFEREQAEARFRENERFLSAVLDAIQDGISVLAPDLTIIRANQTVKSWYPHMLPLEGRKCYEVYHGRSKPCKTCPTLRAMETGQIEKCELPKVSCAGRTLDLELISFPMLDKSGKPGAAIECVRDITERKRSERLVQEREQLYRSLFEKNHSVMLLIDPETAGIVDANPSACAFYGYTKEKLTAMRISDINVLSPGAVFQEMERAKSEKRSYFNFPHCLSDGTLRDVEVFSGPITVGGRALLCSIVHDISERKLAEAERERLIGELRKALSEVKTLQGFLPICSSCKKIRDDRGYWNQIEAYLHAHSEARFSHGICPDCALKLYPDYDLTI